MTVTPHDLETYLVSSRTREGVEHLVDLSTLECSCEASLDYPTYGPDHPCPHIEAALAFRAGAVAVRAHVSLSFLFR